MTLTVIERQEESVFLKENSYLDGKRGCWLWKLSKGKNGYGQYWFRNKKISIHRLAYAVFIGDFDDSLYVLHKCDVKYCINPEHLFLGTQADNMSDRDTKGKTPKGERNGMFGRTGEKHPSTKLQERQVFEILAKRKKGLTLQKIVKEYGISLGAIQNIVKRRTWKHLG